MLASVSGGCDGLPVHPRISSINRPIALLSVDHRASAGNYARNLRFLSGNVSNMSMLEAVADPVRLRVLRHLSHGRTASLADLADAAGVHANTVRTRIAELEDSAVIEGVPRGPSGRCRPTIGYRLAAGWSVPTSDFRGLAQLLAAVALRAHAPRPDLPAVRSEWGRHLQGRPGGHDVHEDLPQALEQLGFDARVEDSALLLDSC